MSAGLDCLSCLSPALACSAASFSNPRRAGEGPVEMSGQAEVGFPPLLMEAIAPVDLMHGPVLHNHRLQLFIGKTCIV